jgi:TonB family protein
MAMYLTGAGAVSLDDSQRRRSPSPPPLPFVLTAPPPAPPPPARAQPPQRARANLNAYFSADDYPAGLERGEGTSSFRLTIGPNGRVADCVITRSSGIAALDQATCRILRSRARYTPARDSAGNPTTGSDSGRVSWRLPEESETPAERRAGIPVPFTRAQPRAPLQSYVSARDYPAAARDRAVGISSVRLVIGMTGRVIACDVVEDRGASAALGGGAACRIARARALYTPARSQAGGFVCDVAFEDVLWRLPPRRRAAAPPPIAQQLAPGICPGRTP